MIPGETEDAPGTWHEGMRAWIGGGNFRGSRWAKNNSFLSIWKKPNGEDVKEEALGRHVIESVSPGLPNFLPFR